MLDFNPQTLVQAWQATDGHIHRCQCWIWSHKGLFKLGKELMAWSQQFNEFKSPWSLKIGAGLKMGFTNVCKEGFLAKLEQAFVASKQALSRSNMLVNHLSGFNTRLWFKIQHCQRWRCVQARKVIDQHIWPWQCLISSHKRVFKSDKWLTNIFDRDNAWFQVTNACPR